MPSISSMLKGLVTLLGILLVANAITFAILHGLTVEPQLTTLLLGIAFLLMVVGIVAVMFLVLLERD